LTRQPTSRHLKQGSEGGAQPVSDPRGPAARAASPQQRASAARRTCDQQFQNLLFQDQVGHQFAAHAVWCAYPRFVREWASAHQINMQRFAAAISRRPSRAAELCTTTRGLHVLTDKTEAI